MAITVSKGGNWVQGAAYIGYNNLLENSLATITVNVEEDDYPVTNLASWATYERYRFTMVGNQEVRINISFAEPFTVNALGLFRHNLGNKALRTVLQYSDDGITWSALDADLVQIHGAENDVFFVVTDSPQTKKLWRIKISQNPAFETNVFEIGNAFVGEALQLFSNPETGFTPPNFIFEDKYINTQSDRGDFLGRSRIRKGGKGSFRMTQVNDDWVRDYWLPFLAEAEAHPFYFAWDSELRRNESAFCYLDRAPAKPTYSGSKLMTVPLDFVSMRG